MFLLTSLVLCFTFSGSVLFPLFPDLKLLSINSRLIDGLVVLILLLLGLFWPPLFFQGLLFRGRFFDEERLVETVAAQVALLPYNRFKKIRNTLLSALCTTRGQWPYISRSIGLWKYLTRRNEGQINKDMHARSFQSIAQPLAIQWEFENCCSGLQMALEISFDILISDLSSESFIYLWDQVSRYLC